MAQSQGERNRRWRFGLEPEEYEALLNHSDGACYICGTIPERTLHIDHDHETGRIRGLLCQPCNHMVGLSYDNPETLRKAADYLEL